MTITIPLPQGREDIAIEQLYAISEQKGWSALKDAVSDAYINIRMPLHSTHTE